MKRIYSKVGCADCGWRGSAGVITRYNYVNGKAQPYEACPNCESLRIFGAWDFDEYPDLFVVPWVRSLTNER